jgi:tryptophanyl-tRNA synthetase
MVGNPARVEAILKAGAEKARELSRPFMAELREAVGLRNLSAQVAVAQDKAARPALPGFKQYREADGKFYFKLVDPGGVLLLQSPAFESPREPCQLIAGLKAGEAAAVAQVSGWWQPGVNAQTVLARLTEG